MGAWAPIARKAGVSPAGGRPIARGFAIAVAGATMVGAAVIALSMAYVGRWGMAGGFVAASAVAGVVFRRSFIPFVAAFEREGA